MFAMAGRKVRIAESSERQRQSVQQRIAESLRDLKRFGLLDQDIDPVLSLQSMTYYLTENPVD